MVKDTIKSFRKQAGLTQTQLAKKLEVTQSTVAKYENGVNDPSNEMINKMIEGK